MASPTDTARVRQDIRIIVFPGGFNWPIFIAQERGLFAEQGLDVILTPTTNSKQQMAGLIDDEYDIAMTALDNVIAYNAGQGEAPTQNKSDLVAILGADSGFLHLVARPEIGSITALKGCDIAVDALTTGYAFVLLRMLELAGVAQSDVTFVEAGGVLARFEALLQKKFDATLLVSPFDAAAGKQGFVSLGSGLGVLGAYQGVVAAVRRDWANENRTAVEGYITAWRQALDWLVNPANRDDAVAVLQRHLPNMATAVAEASYGILLDVESGFYRDAALRLMGARIVFELRQTYGAKGADLGQIEDHIDTSFYNNASAGRPS